MKHFLLLFIISTSSYFSMAQSDKAFTISEIGWSYFPPAGFKFVDSSSNNFKVSENLTIWRKSLRFKKYPGLHNLISCSIATESQNESELAKMRPIESKRTYDILTNQYPNLHFDSSTTTLIIDGIRFYKFSMIGTGNGQPEYNHIELTRLYKGYRINFVYIFDEKSVGSEIEKQLLDSKFSK